MSSCDCLGEQGSAGAGNVDLSASQLLRRREAWVWSALAISVFLVGVTEILGAWHALDRMGLTACWALGIAGTIGWCWRRRARLSSPAKIRPAQTMRPTTVLERGLTFGLAAIAVITLATALIAPPNNWDSMTYHMARVAHWRQNHSVDFYPTPILR